MRRAAGFTLVELIMVIVMLGVLAAVAIPRLSTNEYRAIEFHDKVISALRYAQKTATSHRRLVCVTFPNNTTVNFAIAQSQGATTCGTTLPLPSGPTNSGATNSVASGAAEVNFVSGNTNFEFQSDGRGVDRSIVIADLPAIKVVGATGYVQ